MPTPYEKLYENLLPKFKSYKIPLMTEDEVKKLLGSYISSAASRFHVCKKNLNERDDDAECFNAELSDTEIEILSNFLLLEYIDANYIRTPTLLQVSLSSTDFNAFSNANHLKALMTMHTVYRKENETLLSRYSWVENSYSENAISKLKKSMKINK